MYLSKTLRRTTDKQAEIKALSAELKFSFIKSEQICGFNNTALSFVEKKSGYLQKQMVCIYIILLFISLIISNKAFAQQSVYKGIYQGENLYVQNPFGPNGIGFCVKKVLVNGKITDDVINSSAFEIDLSVFNFNFRDSVKIVLEHKKNCKPSVLNLVDIQPKSTFKIVSIKFNEKSGTLSWITEGEISSLLFIVELFRWNKWIQMKEKVKGKGNERKHKYSMKVPTHSGKNRFRVKQIDASNKPRYSEEVVYNSPAPAVTFSPAKPKTVIKFSATTDFEVFNFYGQLVRKGSGKFVNISDLKKGDYFLHYGNSTGQFHKK